MANVDLSQLVQQKVKDLKAYGRQKTSSPKLLRVALINQLNGYKTFRREKGKGIDSFVE